MWYYVAYVYNGELISLIGNQRVGIFPPKSEILFVLSLALIWCRNFQDRTIPVGGDTWPSYLAERKKKKNEIYICEAVCDAVREWSEVTRPTANCQTTFFRRFKQFGKILKKVAEHHATVVGYSATVGRLSVNLFWTFQAIWTNFE